MSKIKKKKFKKVDTGPVMCVETGQVFESANDARLWHYIETGFKSDINYSCKKGSATKPGYHFRYVQKDAQKGEQDGS